MADEPDVDAVREFLFRRYPMPALRPVAPEDEFVVGEAAMAEIETIIRTQVLPFEPAFRALDKRRRARSKAGGSLANILFGDDITAQIKAAAMEDPVGLSTNPPTTPTTTWHSPTLQPSRGITPTTLSGWPFDLVPANGSRSLKSCNNLPATSQQ